MDSIQPAMRLKTILKPFTLALDKLHVFRVNHLFITPKEGRRLMQAYARNCQQDITRHREQFREAILKLQQIESAPGRHGYEIKMFIDRDSLETGIGEKVAIADISMQVAKMIVERHQKHKKPECKNSDNANTKPNNHEPNKQPEIQTARQ